jgi:hypothetical protein
MKHEFHFILEQKQYFKLLKLSKRLNKNLSATIVIAFENLNTFIEKNHLASQEKKSCYKTLVNTEENCHHIHCYLPQHLYRKLKHIHHDLDTYSLAQIMRKIIEYFFMGCFKYGENDFIERLGKINKNWEKIKSEYRKEKRIFKRPMSYKFYQIPYLITIYGIDSYPYLIQFF